MRWFDRWVDPARDELAQPEPRCGVLGSPGRILSTALRRPRAQLRRRGFAQRSQGRRLRRQSNSARNQQSTATLRAGMLRLETAVPDCGRLRARRPSLGVRSVPGRVLDGLLGRQLARPLVGSRRRTVSFRSAVRTPQRRENRDPTRRLGARRRPLQGRGTRQIREPQSWFVTHRDRSVPTRSRREPVAQRSRQCPRCLRCLRCLRCFQCCRLSSRCSTASRRDG